MTVKNYLLLFLLMVSFNLNAQKKNSDPMSEATFKGLKLRNVGPAFTSGRIMHKESISIAKSELQTLKGKLSSIVKTTLPALEKGLQAVGAPMIEG
ncbi:MAG: hypothetical protein AB8G86_13595, partial [Saprospiraceae bacterium]